MIAVLLSLCSQAQILSGGTATPAASSAKAGNISYAYRIGYMGSARVSTLAKPTAEQQNAFGQISEPQNEYTALPTAVRAYPNPFTEEIRVVFPLKKNAGMPTIQLIDNCGRLLESECQYSEKDGQKGTAIIKAANLSSGKYIIRIITGGCVYAVNAIKI